MQSPKRMISLFHKQTMNLMAATPARHYAQLYLPRMLAHQGACGMVMRSKTSISSTVAQSYLHRGTSQMVPFSTSATTTKTTNPVLDEKKQWDHQRFGHLDHTRLGRLETIPESMVHWPVDHSMTFHSCKNRLLNYRMCDVNKEAERIAEIYQAAIDEQQRNSDYEWHHSPHEIRQRVASGQYSIWGTYDVEEINQLIAVNSVEKMPGQRGLHWIWFAVHPSCRGRGVAENTGIFMDAMMEKSGSQYGCVWMASTHNLSQRMIERVPGWRPVGFFYGGELLGGTDGKFFRENVIWYSKLFNRAEAFTQSLEDMVLTKACKRIAKAVLDDEQDME
jgi:GNAT superfamily N-acetyltransferase